MGAAIRQGCHFAQSHVRGEPRPQPGRSPITRNKCLSCAIVEEPQFIFGRRFSGMGNGKENSRCSISEELQSSRVPRMPSGESSAMRTCSQWSLGRRSSNGSARNPNPISSSAFSAVNQSTSVDRARPSRSMTTKPSPWSAIQPSNSLSRPRRCSIHCAESIMSARLTAHLPPSPCGVTHSE